MVKTLPAGTELIRARRHKPTEHFDTMADLGTPPKRKASTNRMSPSGIAMFYGAFDAKTAIAEVCSDPTDDALMVTSAPFVLRKPMRVIDLTAVPPVPSVFDRQRAEQRVPSLFLRGFVRDFVKPVKKDGREHIEYVPTQIVTEYVRRVFRDRSGEKVHGIIYPSSVEDGLSCVLFLESAPDSERAHLYPDTIEKWLKLDKSRIKSQNVAPHT